MMLSIAAHRVEKSIISRLVAYRSGLLGMLYDHVEFYFHGLRKALVINPKVGTAWVERQYDPERWGYYFPPLQSGEAELIYEICDKTAERKPKYDWPGILSIATLGIVGKQNPRWWFCSEFIVDTFQRIGYLEPFTRMPHTYSPALLCYAVDSWYRQPESVKRIYAELAAERRARK